MGTETMLEKVNALGNRLVAKAPGRLRIAFNEDDNSKEPQPECAHFLKLDGRRVGRDFELYNFMAKVTGGDSDQPGIVMLLQELVLPLQEAAPEAFQEGIAFMREQNFGDKQADWEDLLATLAD
jgi:hypothetical protein